MALSLTNLVPQNPSARGKSFVSWNYITSDTSATVAGANYFNKAASVLSVGDVINVVITVSSVPYSFHKFLVLSISAAGVVDVTNAFDSASSLE